MICNVIVWSLCISFTTVAASECEICFRGKCLAPTQLKAGGEVITASTSATDLKNNILYAVRNNTLQAIHLDDNSVDTIPTKEPGRIARLRVDQVSGDVYYGYGGASLRTYRYIPTSGETQPINHSSKHMWAHNGSLYFAGLAKGLSSIKGALRKSVDTFKTVKVGSLVFDKFGNMYASTTGKVYKAKPNEAKTVLTASSYGLRSDVNGDVYLNSKNHLIYQLDLDTEHIDVVGAFGAQPYNYISNFAFDKYSNIIAKTTSSSFVHFKYNSDECTISNTDSTPYITNITSPPKGQEGPKNVEDDPHFGD